MIKYGKRTEATMLVVMVMCLQFKYFNKIHRIKQLSVS